MGNPSEREIVQLVAEKFESKGYLTIEELSVGYGRADIAAFRLEEKNAQTRLDYHQFNPILNVMVLALYLNIPSNSLIGFDSIKRIFKYNLEKNISICRNISLRKAINWLSENNYLKLVDNQFIKVNSFHPLTNETLAIEVKIGDWQRGGRQAYRYRVFADRTYLAILAENKQRVKKGVFENKNIGIISVDYHNRAVVIDLQPRRIIPDPVQQALAVELLWNEWIKNYRRKKNASKYHIS